MMGNYHVRFDGGFREKVSIQTTRPFTYPTMVVELILRAHRLVSILDFEIWDCQVLFSGPTPASHPFLLASRVMTGRPSRHTHYACSWIMVEEMGMRVHAQGRTGGWPGYPSVKD